MLGYRLGCEAVIPSHHCHLDAGISAVANGFWHLRPWGVVEAKQPHQDLVALQAIPPAISSPVPATGAKARASTR